MSDVDNSRICNAVLTVDDLYQKVIAAIERGEHPKPCESDVFSISRDMIDLWLKHCAVTRTIQAALGYQHGHSHRIRNWID